MKNLMLSPKYYVFFDVDGTLINIKSTHSFLRFYYQYRFQKMHLLKYLLYTTKIKLYEKMGIDRSYLNVLYYKNFTGEKSNVINQLAQQWFSRISKNPKLFLAETLSELIKHQSNDAEIVLVSGSFQECLLPLAEKLKIKHVIATQLVVKNNVLTGHIQGAPMIGKNKAVAIENFLKKQGFVDLDRCHAYGDHDSDYPMLNLVGNRHVIPGDKKLVTRAKQLNWSILFNNYDLKTMEASK